MLKVGQAVSLKDEGSAYSISFIEPEVPLGHTVVEIGENYVVVRDIAGITDTTVPVYSLKAVQKVRVKIKSAVLAWRLYQRPLYCVSMWNMRHENAWPKPI